MRALNAIADTGGVRIEWLLTGNGPMTGSASHGKDQEAITIEMLDVRVSAGDGEWVLEEVSLGQFVLDQPYFQREIGLDPALCRIVKVSGDSMEPTFRSGDPVLVNLAENQQPADGIWVIRIGLGTFVKRLQFMLGGTVRVVSDNPAYQDQVLDLTEEQPDFQMIGRVVWSPRLH